MHKYVMQNDMENCMFGVLSFINNLYKCMQSALIYILCIFA